MQKQDKRLEEAFIGLLTILSIVLLIVMVVIQLSPVWLFTLYTADLVICIALAWNFAARFPKESGKMRFLRYHGYEILTFIPAIAFYSVDPFLPIVVFLRVLRLITVVSVVLHYNQLMNSD